MSPFITQIVGVGVRAALVWLSAWLVAHGGPSFTTGQMEKAIAEVTPVAAAIIWSVWEKYRGRLTTLVALGTAAKMTLEEARMQAMTGQAPSVHTPSNVVPRMP